MRAELKQDGTLALYPDNELEMYALTKWMDDLENKAVTIKRAKLDGDDD